MKRRFTYMHTLVGLVIAAIVTACASIGRPEGGPRDEDPPVYVRSNPRPGQLRVDGKKITVTFDENIQLNDAFNKVVVSPVQIQAPSISSNARSISVELRDTLIANTTYSIDFGDAIKDLNEGNILDGFALDFSTGDSIDTLRISGIVLEARTLEPAQGMLVGVHSNLDDTAITNQVFDRIARTNQYGQFTIRNLKPGNYRVFALNDLNRDYKWDRSEDVAFYDYTVSPSIEAIEVCDTFLREDGTDSLVAHPGLKYLPNDILLTWFNEGYKPQYLQDYKRIERNKITINFAAQSDTLPELTIVDGELAGRTQREWSVPQINPTRDSLVYWISDSMVYNTDSLRLAVKYLKTDTAEQLVWQSDTLRFFFRDPKPKKKSKKEEEADTVRLLDGIPQPKDFLNFTPPSSTQDVYAPLVLKSATPIDTILPDGVRLEMLVDTIWENVTGIKFAKDSLQPLLNRVMKVDWNPGGKYRISIDSMAVSDIYGLYNKSVKQEFTVKNLDEYSNLKFNISGLETDSVGNMPQLVVELLGSDDKPVRTVKAKDGVADFKYLDPSVYYARLFIDGNGNGKWDTGNIADSIQPEEVYYYNKKLQLKKNWDVSQSWDIYELALDAQKPIAIKKNKPKPKKGERLNSDEDNEEEFDEFGNPIDYNNQYDRNDRSNINNRRSTNTPSSSGRFQTSRTTNSR